MKEPATIFRIGIFILSDVFVHFLQVQSRVPFDFSLYPECMQSNSSLPFVPMPVLADQFTALLEGKIYSTFNSSTPILFESDAIHDLGGERVASTSYYKGRQVTYLTDISSGNMHTIKDGICDTTPITEATCDTFNIMMCKGASRAHEIVTCQLDLGNVAYLGDKRGNDQLRVRDIHVRKWSQCIYENITKSLTLAEYYFNADSIETASGEPNVPIRYSSRLIPLKNPASTVEPFLTKVFDFTYYAPLAVDPSMLLPPPGVYCNNWKRENKTMPVLPDSFSVSLLTVFEVGQEIHALTIDFDLEHERVAFISDYVNGSSYPPSVLNNPNKRRNVSRVVLDYPSGLSFRRYRNDPGSPNSDIECLTAPIPANVDGDVHLGRADAIFGLNRNDWMYYGERKFDVIPADVFVRQEIAPVDNRTTVTEVYWSKPSATTKSVLVGIAIYLKHAHGSILETIRSTVSDYRPNPYSVSDFTVHECIRSTRPLNVAFDVKFSKDYPSKPAWTSMRSVLDALNSAVARVLDVSDLRLTELTMHWNSEDHLKCHVWMPIDEWTTVLGRAGAPAKKEKPSREAAQRLAQLLAGKDLTLNITVFGGYRTVTLLRDSVTYGTDLERPGWLTQLPSDSLSYSGGSMTGLAFSMLLIGAAVGFGIGFLLWKRADGVITFDMQRTSRSRL